MFKRILFTVVMIGLLVPAAFVSAQEDTRTVEITEAQLNESFRVTNPWRRSLTDMSVDIQEGQAVISGTYTRRAFSVGFSAIYQPSIEGGDIYWTLVSFDVDGTGVPQSTLDTINNSLARELRRTVKSYYNFFTVTDIQLSGDVVTISYIANGRAQ